MNTFVRSIAGASALLLAAGIALPSAAADPTNNSGPHQPGPHPFSQLHDPVNPTQNPISAAIAFLFFHSGVIFIPNIPPGAGAGPGTRHHR